MQLALSQQQFLISHESGDPGFWMKHQCRNPILFSPLKIIVQLSLGKGRTDWFSWPSSSWEEG